MDDEGMGGWMNDRLITDRWIGINILSDIGR